MQIQINPGDIEDRDRITELVEREVADALHVFEEQVTRVEVHLRDVNRTRGGADRHCLLEIRLAGHQPLAVEHDAADFDEAIKVAAGKAERAVRHKLERHEERKRGHREP